MSMDRILLIVLFVVAGKTNAQTRLVNGIVRNVITGGPVPYASVMMKGTQHGVSTDSAGKFVLEVPVNGHETELEISSLGFETGTIRFIDSDKAEQICNLMPAASELEKFEIRSFTCYRRRTRCGTITAIRYTTGREANEFSSENNLVVYPNPIPAGNNIRAALQLKVKGEYRLDLVDAGGRIVWMRTININETKYNISIPTQSLWSAGVYWLRISGRHSKEVYSGKIVVQ